MTDETSTEHADGNFGGLINVPEIASDTDDGTVEPEPIRIRILAEGRHIFSNLVRWPHGHTVEAEHGDIVDVHPDSADVVQAHLDAGESNGHPTIELAPDAEVTPFPKPEPVEDEAAPAESDDDVAATRTAVQAALEQEKAATEKAQTDAMAAALAKVHDSGQNGAGGLSVLQDAAAEAKNEGAASQEVADTVTEQAPTTEHDGDTPPAV